MQSLSFLTTRFEINLLYLLTNKFSILSNTKPGLCATVKSTRFLTSVPSPSKIPANQPASLERSSSQGFK